MCFRLQRAPVGLHNILYTAFYYHIAVRWSEKKNENKYFENIFLMIRYCILYKCTLIVLLSGVFIAFGRGRKKIPFYIAN